MFLTAVKTANCKSRFYCLIFLHTVHLKFVAAPLYVVNYSAVLHNLPPSNRCYLFALPLATKSTAPSCKRIFYFLIGFYIRLAASRGWLYVFLKKKPQATMLYGIRAVLRSSSVSFESGSQELCGEMFCQFLTEKGANGIIVFESRKTTFAFYHNALETFLTLS